MPARPFSAVGAGSVGVGGSDPASAVTAMPSTLSLKAKRPAGCARYSRARSAPRRDDAPTMRPADSSASRCFWIACRVSLNSAARSGTNAGVLNRWSKRSRTSLASTSMDDARSTWGASSTTDAHAGAEEKRPLVTACSFHRVSLWLHAPRRLTGRRGTAPNRAPGGRAAHEHEDAQDKEKDPDEPVEDRGEDEDEDAENDQEDGDGLRGHAEIGLGHGPTDRRAAYHRSRTDDGTEPMGRARPRR